MAHLIKIQRWHIILASACSAIGALLSAGQAVTFAWLSAFPERSLQLDELRYKFWFFLALAGVLFVTFIGSCYLLYRYTRKGK